MCARTQNKEIGRFSELKVTNTFIAHFVLYHLTDLDFALSSSHFKTLRGELEMPGINQYSLEDIRTRSGSSIGARKGDILIARRTYDGLKVQTHADQDERMAKSKFIKGNFTVIDSGKGKYSEYIKPLIGQTFDSVGFKIEVNKNEKNSGKKPTYTYGTAQDILGILCPKCQSYQTSLDSCECGYERKF